MEDNIDDIDLECPICYELMETIHMFVGAPNDVGCTHNFCPVCAAEVLGRAKKTGDDALCPMCRRVVVGVVTNALATSLAKINKTLKLKQAIDARDAAAQLDERIERVTQANITRLQEYDTQLTEMNERVRASSQKEGHLQQQLEELQVHRENATGLHQLKERLDREREQREQLEEETSKMHSAQMQIQELHAQTEKRLEDERRRHEQEILEKQEQLHAQTDKLLEEERQQYEQRIIEKQQELHAQTEKRLGEERRRHEQELQENQKQARELAERENEEASNLRNELERHSEEMNQRLLSIQQRELNSWKQEDDPSSVAATLWEYCTTTPVSNLSFSLVDYVVLECRGNKRNGCVKRAKNICTGRQCALKWKKGGTPRGSLFREAMMYFYFTNHPYIVNFMGVYVCTQDPDTRKGHHWSSHLQLWRHYSICVSLEYWPYDLEYVIQTSHSSQRIDKLPKAMGVTHLATMTAQIACGVQCMHDCGVVHRTLTSSSILVNETLQCCVGGLTDAVSVFNQPFTVPCVDTLYACAPEVLHQLIEGQPNLMMTGDGWKAADMWSLGCILFEWFTGSKLFVKNFSGLNASQAALSVLTEMWAYKELKPQHDMSLAPELIAAFSKPPTLSIRDELQASNVPDEWISLILSLMHLRPTTRPTTGQLLHHPLLIGQGLSSGSWKHVPASHFSDYNLKNFIRLTNCPALTLVQMIT